MGVWEQLSPPVLGEAGIRCLSSEAGELEWNVEQGHQARVQPSTGEGVLFAPVWEQWGRANL